MDLYVRRSRALRIPLMKSFLFIPHGFFSRFFHTHPRAGHACSHCGTSRASNEPFTQPAPPDEDRKESRGASVVAMDPPSCCGRGKTSPTPPGEGKNVGVEEGMGPSTCATREAQEMIVLPEPDYRGCEERLLGAGRDFRTGMEAYMQEEPDVGGRLRLCSSRQISPPPCILEGTALERTSLSCEMHAKIEESGGGREAGVYFTSICRIDSRPSFAWDQHLHGARGRPLEFHSSSSLQFFHLYKSHPNQPGCSCGAGEKLACSGESLAPIQQGTAAHAAVSCWGIFGSSSRF